MAVTERTILIVEDDRHLLRLYKAELAAEGYRILVARNGKEATALVAEENPDVVVMDIRMPEMDGLDAMSEILRQNQKTRIILNSAYSCYQDDFLTWAADAYLIKSADLGPLKGQIRSLLAA